MSFSYPEIRSFVGLYLQQNSLTVPDGALETALNVVISKDGQITKRRGYYTFYSPITGTLNRLFTYQNVLMAAFQTKLSYLTETGTAPNKTGVETALSGQTVAITNGRVARTVQSNRNLYFTTDNGLLKITAYNSTIAKSGSPQGLDVAGRFVASSASAGVFASGATWGYRVVFGYRDSNDNLILGAPSDITTLTNTAVVGKAVSCSTNTLTVTSTAHGLVSGMYLTFANAAGFTDAANNAKANGTYQITVTTADAFTYTVASGPTGGPGTIDYYYAGPVELEFSVPSEIGASDGYFYQIYRSSQVQTGTIFSDFKLTDELTLTSAQITAGVVFYSDDIDDILLGAELYTNQNSREGELQANTRAPKAEDVTLYKGYTIYGNCTTRQLLQFNVIDSTLLASGDWIETKVDSTVRRYVARTGVGNQTRLSQTVTGSGPLVVTYVAHGLLVGDTVYISNVTGGSYANQTVTLTAKTADTFTFTPTGSGSPTALEFQGVTGLDTIHASSSVSGAVTLTVTFNGHGIDVGVVVFISTVVGGSYANQRVTVTAATTNTFTFTAVGSGSATSLNFQAVYPIFYLSTSSSASVRLRDTAQGIVKAMNRDTGSLVYAQYSSGTNAIPGQMTLQAKGFTGIIYLRASAATPASAFSPVLPTAFSSGTQIYSRNDELPHVFFSSKLNEPEAVPLVNFFTVGARNKEILRVVALRDSLIVIKEDGVYRVTGDAVSNFNVTTLDSTVFCVAASSVDVINNQAIFLSNQGVCLVTESSVQIVSRKIEDVIQPILGQVDIASVTSGVGYESERLYLLTTSDPNDTDATNVWAFNVLTEAWTLWDTIFSQASLGPQDRLYYIPSATNAIMRERKYQTRTDYTAESYTVTVSAVSSDKTTCTLTVPMGETPESGDVVVKSNVINRITAVTAVSSTTFTVEFLRASNLVNADSEILYRYITSQVGLAPFHAGLVGRTKQFSQVEVHFRDAASCSRLSCYFVGPTFGGSASQEWESTFSAAGWGLFPWGFEPWGQGEGVNLPIGTQPAAICRVYVPLFQQRTVWIQPYLEHSEAGETFSIQAMAFAVRAYGERVSR